MNVVHLNAQSMCNKFAELEIFVNGGTKPVDVFCVTEHFLLEDMIEYYSVEGFRIVSYYTRGRRRGGSLVMCRVGVGMQAVSVAGLVELSVSGVCEIAAVDIHEEHLRIVSVYRPPDGDLSQFIDIMDRVLEKSEGRGLDVVVTGDFNVHFHTTDRGWREFDEVMLSYGYQATIFEPTRGGQCLDNIYVNFSGCRHFQSDMIDPGLSDHGAVSIQVARLMGGNKASKIKKLHISQPLTEAGKIIFFNLIEQLEWSFIDLNTMSVGDKFEIFINSITWAVDRAFPTRMVFATQRANCDYLGWYSSDLRKQREHLHLLCELKNNYPENEVFMDAFKRHKKSYRRNVVETRRAWYSKRVSESGNKIITYWDIINKHRTRRGESVAPNIDVRELNEFFIKVAADIKSDLPVADHDYTAYLRDHAPPCTHGKFNFGRVTYIQVRDAINAMKNKMSRDYYGINVALIKCVRDHVVSPLTKLFNMSIETGVYPDALKITKVIPVHKKGDTSECGNYRPISLVPVVSKIFEHLLKAQIVRYFEELKLFYEGQYGFRKGRSTCDAIMRLVATLVKGMEAGEIAGAHFYDLTKAFDCVSPDRLIAKFRYYNFGEDGCKLLCSYLTNRRQYVCLDGVSSSLEGIVGGVPQGSVLGPILFLIYVNDMVEAVDEVGLLLFADDAATVGSESEETRLVDLMGDAESSLRQWLCANDLSMNANKTSKLFFTHRQVESSEVSPTAKYLGVVLDSKLSWEGHVDCLAKKIAKNIYLIRKLSGLLPADVMLMTYYSLVESHMRYALLVWGHSSHATRIFALQRRVVRILVGRGYRDSVRDVFARLGILTLPSMYIYYCLLMTKQDGDCPLRGDIHQHNTRCRDRIDLPFIRLSSSRYSKNYYGSVFMNKLPRKIASLPFIKFKRTIKDFLVNKSYYDTDEFLNDHVVEGGFSVSGG